MDNMREKLEILRHKLAGMISAAVEPCDEGECCESCKYFHSTACTDYLIADYMIANGVTVQEWIPVSERLPTKEDGDDYGFVYTLETDGKRYVRYWGTVVVHTKNCTHWMPLPQPPLAHTL